VRGWADPAGCHLLLPSDENSNIKLGVWRGVNFYYPGEKMGPGVADPFRKEMDSFTLHWTQMKAAQNFRDLPPCAALCKLL